MLRLALLLSAALTAAEHRGTVLFGGLPVPGAAVSAHGQRTITDTNGAFLLQNLPAGPITIHIEMQLFAPQIAQIPNPAEPSKFELELAPVTPAKVTVATTKSAFQRPETKTTAPPNPRRPARPRNQPARRRRPPHQRLRQQRRRLPLRPTSRLRQQPPRRPLHV